MYEKLALHMDGFIIIITGAIEVCRNYFQLTPAGLHAE